MVTLKLICEGWWKERVRGMKGVVKMKGEVETMWEVKGGDWERR